MKALLSNNPIVADIDDAEIRNAIEGFASELEMAERAESAANIWYEETFCGFPVDIGPDRGICFWRNLHGA